MSCVKCEDCQVRVTRTVLRSGPLVTSVTESTLSMTVGGTSRVPGSMFQASYCLGVSLNAWSWLPQALEANDSVLEGTETSEVMQPVLRSMVSLRFRLLSVNAVAVSVACRVVPSWLSESRGTTANI